LSFLDSFDLGMVGGQDLWCLYEIDLISSCAD